ncbi:MAG: MoxR family ATPase [Cytophagales bacterium]
MEYKDDVQLAKDFAADFIKLKNEISKVVVGQEQVVDLVLTSIFCGGHCLLVGVPGLAKTLLINTISSCLDLSFNRIQFTPDLMPSDIVGSETMDVQRNLKFVKGPVFSNILLADEINRTPPKTQAALLECMQEKSVTVAGTTYKLDLPFFVLATQNPIEQEGTYPLPEAQLDRFMFNIFLDYPSFEEEVWVVKNTTNFMMPSASQILTKEKILAYQELIKKVPVTDNVVEYAVKLVHKTRPNSKFATESTNTYLEWGAGPRASQQLIVGAKCKALQKGKFSPDIEDVQDVAIPVLRHRVVLNFKAEADKKTVEDIIKSLF